MASNILLLLISHLLMKFTEGAGLCSDFLLPTIPDSHLAASSSLNIAGSNGYTGPDRARLDTKQTTLGNTTILMGGWAPGSDNKGQYIQATFDDLTYIEKIVTQGQNPGGGYVKLYRLEYTEDGTNWQPVNMVKSSAGVEQIFRGNSDADTHVEEELDCPVFAKGIRLYPLEWESHIALRFDVKGCYLDNNALATPPPTVTTSVGTPLTTPTTSVTSTIRTIPTTPTTLPTTPTTPPTTPTTPSTTPSTTSTTPTTTPTTTPITTPRATTTPPFMPGIPTPFGLPYTTPRTVLLTSTSTTPTPMTTIPTTKSTTVSTTPVTTTASTTTSSTTKSTTTTPLTTTKSTTIPAKTFPPFLPGIQNPFGSTKQPFVVIG